MFKLPLFTLYHILRQVCRGFHKLIKKNKLVIKRRMNMAKALSYKKSTTVTVKAAGYVDIEKELLKQKKEMYLSKIY